jgi:Ulp1 family protease
MKVVDCSSIYLRFSQDLLSDTFLNILRDTRPIKILPLLLHGNQSGIKHWFVLYLDSSSHTMRWIDSACGPEGSAMSRERSSQLVHIRRFLARAANDTAAWKDAEFSEWTGWERGVPQQDNDIDCALFCFYFIKWLALGEQPWDIAALETEELRGTVAEDICCFALGC